MSKIKYTVRDKVAIITLENPPLNTFGYELRQDLAKGIEQAETDPTVQAVVIMGSDHVFSGGADIAEFGTEKVFIEPNIRNLIALIESCSKPIIAAMSGVSLGGGFEVALGCHYRVAKPDASVGLPEVKLGILPGAGGTQRLPRLIGIEKSLNMIITGNPMMADQLKDTELFDEIIDGDLLAGAVKFAEYLIAKGSPLKRARDIKIKERFAEAYIKFARNTVSATVKNYPAPLKCIEAIEACLTKSFDDGLKLEWELILSLFQSPESQALRHLFFAEKAAPKVPDVPQDTVLRKVEKVAVVGAGMMGGGIAMSFLNAGIPVTLLEVSQESLDKGLATIQKNYMSSLQKGKVTLEQLETIKRLLTPTLSYDDLKDADLIVEAVFEDMTIKKGVFEHLDKIAKKGAILATNTSTLDLNKIASFTKRPQDIIGMHFFSPAHIMKLVEIVRGKKTAKDVISTILDVSKRIKKIGVISGVCDGFIGNRMIVKYLQASIELLQRGASPMQIDKALEKWGMVMGPFKMADLSGNDVGWYIRKRHYVENPDMKHDIISDRICELGRFGQKTGAGWYRYEAGSRDPLPDPIVENLIHEVRTELGLTARKIEDEEIIERCIYSLINEGARILEEGIAQRASDIDVIYIYGYGFPAHRGGPMFYADMVSPFAIVRTLKRFAREPGGDVKFWEPAPLLLRLVEEGKTFTKG